MLHTFLKYVASVLRNRNPQASGLKAGNNVNVAHIEIIQHYTLPCSGQWHNQTPPHTLSNQNLCTVN